MDRVEKAGLITIVLLAAVLGWLMRHPYLTVVNHDSAMFCLLGQALAQGQGYILLSEPFPQPYFTFPPLLPVFIALTLKLIGTTEVSQAQDILKGLIHGLFLLSLPLFYGWLRQHVNRNHALTLTLLLAVNPLMYKYGEDVLSDVPYWTLSMAALYAIGWWEEKTRVQEELQTTSWIKRGFWLGITVLGLIIAAFWMRQIGIALAIGFLVHVALSKRWKHLLVCGFILIMAFSAWPTYEHIYRSTHKIHQDTLNQADVDQVLSTSPLKLEFIKHFLIQHPTSQDQAMVVENLGEYINIISTRGTQYSHLLMDQLLPPLKYRFSERNGEKTSKLNLMNYLAPLFILWLLVGAWSYRFRFPALHAYLMLYTAILLVYPYVSPRFLLPVFPFFLLFIYQGVLESLSFIKRSWQHPRIDTGCRAFLIILALVVLCGGHLPQTLRWVHHGFQLKIADVGPSRRPDNRAYYEMLLWIKGHTPVDSLIITRKPPVAYYYSQRKALAFPFTADADRLLSYLREKQTQYSKRFSTVYILEDTAFDESVDYLHSVLKKHPKHVVPVYQDPGGTGTTLWKLLPFPS